MKNKGMEIAAKTIKAIGIVTTTVVPVVVTVAKNGIKGTVKVIKAKIGL